MRTETRIRRMINRAKAVWSELDYAQRRLFEIRTGIEDDDVRARRAARRTIHELEALYAADEAAVRARLTPHGR